MDDYCCKQNGCQVTRRVFQIEVCIAGFGCKRLSIFDKEPRMHTDEHGFARGDPCLSVFIRGCNFFVIAAAMRANFA